MYNPAFVLCSPQERVFPALTWVGTLSRTDSCLAGSRAALKWRGRVVCKQTVIQLSLHRGMYINTPPRSESEPRCSLSIPTHLNTKDYFSFQLRFSPPPASVNLSKKRCACLLGSLMCSCLSVKPARPYFTECLVDLKLHIVTHPIVFIGGQTTYNPSEWCRATAKLGWLKIWFTQTTKWLLNIGVLLVFIGTSPALMMNTLVLISDWAGLM